MTTRPPASHVVARRLAAQGLIGTLATDPVEVVRRLGAVQSQEFASALWAIGLRMRGGTSDSIAHAVDEGRIIRTHVLRPTWHFVAPDDLRWMLALTRDRVHQYNRAGYHELELDAGTLRQCRRVITKALSNAPLTRADISATLAAKGIAAEGRRLAYLLMHEELEGVICSGPRRGKQFTYALVDARVPASATVPRDEAPATLLRRYLAGHGPATLHDFTWWSGLTIADARRAEAMLGAAIERIDGGDTAASRTRATTRRVAVGTSLRGAGPFLALAGLEPPPRLRTPRAWLVPNFDEWFVGYRDRTLVAGSTPPLSALSSSVIVDGVRVGTWTSSATSRDVSIVLERELSAGEMRAVERARADVMAFRQRAETS